MPLTNTHLHTFGFVVCVSLSSNAARHILFDDGLPSSCMNLRMVPSEMLKLIHATAMHDAIISRLHDALERSDEFGWIDANIFMSILQQRLRKHDAMAIL